MQDRAQEVRRDDGERCGYVAAHEGRWRSLTWFGGVLGEHDDEAAARDHVVARGLDALADHWTLTDGESGERQVVCIQQVTPTRVTVALDVYSLPGVPTRTIGVDDLAAGRWRLDHGG